MLRVGSAGIFLKNLQCNQAGGSGSSGIPTRAIAAQYTVADQQVSSIGCKYQVTISHLQSCSTIQRWYGEDGLSH